MQAMARAKEQPIPRRNSAATSTNGRRLSSLPRSFGGSLKHNPKVPIWKCPRLSDLRSTIAPLIAMDTTSPELSEATFPDQVWSRRRCGESGPARAPA